MFKVLRPLGQTPELQRAGFTVSQHRTLEAAQRAIERELTALRKLRGTDNCWLDRVIVDNDGELIP